MELFDYICSLETYDETRLRTRFKGSALVKNLEFHKKYLYDKILGGLRQYHRVQLHTIPIHEHLDYYEILRSRGLDSLAENELNKARKKSQASADLNYLQEILTRRSRNFDAKAVGNTFTEVFTTYLEEVDDHISLTIRRNRANYILAHLLDGVGKGYGFRDPEFALSIGPYEAELHEMLDTEDPTLLRQVHINLMWFYMLRLNNEKALEHARRMIRVYHDHPLMKKNYQERYVKDLNNYINLLFLQEERPEIMRVIEEVEQLPVNSRRMEDCIFDFLPLWKNNYIVMTKTIPDSVAHCDRIFEKLIQREDQILAGKFQVHLSSLVHFYFLQGQHTKLLRVYNMAERARTKQVRRDLVVYNRIMYLLTHLELGNEYLPYLVTSARRYLKTRNWTYQFENIIFQSLMQLAQHPFHRERIPLLQKLKTDLETLLRNNPSEAALMYNFDIMQWVDCKLQNKSLSQYLREEAKKSEAKN